MGEYFSFFDNFCSIQKMKRGPKPRNNNQITEEIVRDYKPKGQYADLLPFSLDDREQTVNLERFVFIKQALDKAIDLDPDPTNKDTTFSRLDLSEINKLRREAFQVAFQLVCPDRTLQFKERTNLHFSSQSTVNLRQSRSRSQSERGVYGVPGGVCRYLIAKMFSVRGRDTTFLPSLLTFDGIMKENTLEKVRPVLLSAAPSVKP